MTVVAAIKAQKKDLKETMLMKTRLDLRSVFVELDDDLVSWREYPHLYLLFLSLVALVPTSQCHQH
jgi:hypothetical protein